MRKALLFITPDALNAELDYLYVANDSLRQNAGARTVQNDEGGIALTTTFTLEAFIRPDAWPAA
jgi:hypothetical protein